MKPFTAITILILKLYLSYKQNNDRILKRIEMIYKNLKIQYGCKDNLLKILQEVKPKKGFQTDNAGEKISIKGISIIDKEKEQK